MLAKGRPYIASRIAIFVLGLGLAPGFDVGAASATSITSSGNAAPSTATSHSDASISALRTKLDRISQQLDDERELRSLATDNANYFMTTVSIIVGIAAVLLTVGGLAATFAGWKLVRDYVNKEFSKRVDDAFDERGRPLLENRAEEIEARIDEVLASRLEQFAQASRGTSGT